MPFKRGDILEFGTKVEGWEDTWNDSIGCLFIITTDSLSGNVEGNWISLPEKYQHKYQNTLVDPKFFKKVGEANLDE